MALRTQQIIAEESGVSQVADPLGGSYFIESLTDKMEAQAMAYIDKIDKMGGIVKAVEEGYPQREIARSAYEAQKRIESGEDVVVGMNRYTMEEPPFEELPEVMETTRSVEERLGEDGRLVLRYSGTEPKARVMIEGKDQDEIDALAAELADTIRGAIGAEPQGARG